MEVSNALSVAECGLFIARPPSAVHGVGSVRLPTIQTVSTPGTTPDTRATACSRETTSSWKTSLSSISKAFFVHEKSVDSSYSSSCGAPAPMMVSPPISGFVNDSQWWLF